ncbi:hypothetical protein AB1Y20_007254 [Prymnesium parvum]
MDTTLHNLPGVLQGARRSAVRQHRLDENCSTDREDDLSASAEGVHEELDCNGEVVALVAMRDIGCGREVYNTYGEHSNRTLLFDYGFTLDFNPLDSAELPAAQVYVALESALGPQGLRRSIRELRRAHHWNAEVEQLMNGTYTFFRSGRPPVELLLAIQLVLFPIVGGEFGKHAASVIRQRFEKLSIARQLSESFWARTQSSASAMSSANVDPCGILLVAVHAHIASLRASSSSTCECTQNTVSAPMCCSGRQVHALRLLSAELEIWQGTIDFLGAVRDHKE